MAYAEVLIPPSVRPESPVEFEQVDDQTTVFTPRFARGLSQRQTWGDPLWSLKLRYKGLSQADRALLKAAVSEARGKGLNVRVTPGTPVLGSFPYTELLSNNDFSSGTTGWTDGSDITGAVADRVYRSTRIANTGTAALLQKSSAPTVTQYRPHALRMFYSGGKYPVGVGAVMRNAADSASIGSSGNSTSFGMLTASGVPYDTTMPLYLADSTSSGPMAGDFTDVSFTSLAPCALVDNGPNTLLYSHDQSNAAWTKNATTVATGIGGAPDGTAAGIQLTETSATSDHYALQAISVSSAVADYCFTATIHSGAIRGWCRVQLNENTGSSAMSVYANLTTGALGTISTGANWASVRAFTREMGNGWYQISIVGRKTNAATSLSALVLLATADNATTNYAGNTGAYLYLYGTSVAQSSVPVRIVLTTSAATTGTAQTGGALYVKGLPASTDGLLLPGDFIEINGELKRVTASLDSDAAGRGYLKFRPGLAIAAADNDPIIVNNPMGRFMIAGMREIEEFGVYTTTELDLIEAPA